MPIRNFLDDNEITNEVDIIYTEVDTEDDNYNSYIEKTVTECITCHSKFIKDSSEIGDCNVDEECPICFSWMDIK